MKMRSFLSLQVLVIPSYYAGIGSAQAAEKWSVGQSVRTTSGNVEGHSSPWMNRVSEYLGIPYAQPPVGSLRWEAPVALRRNTTVVADKFVG
jgi:hypothetical protein